MIAQLANRVDLDPTRRAGLLTQASILTSTTPGSHNNPVARGKFIWTQVLCQQVPDPPPGLNVVEPPFDPTLTTRERFIAHRNTATCAACHSRLDNIGFGFEHYNGVGLWQDLDNGKPIDDSGNVPDGDIAGDFRGAVNLANEIAGSRDVRDCYVGQWLDFASAPSMSPRIVLNKKAAVGFARYRVPAEMRRSHPAMREPTRAVRLSISTLTNTFPR